MRLVLVAVGRRMPPWVEAGFREYASRFAGGFSLDVIEIAPGTRSRAGEAARAVREEGARMAAQIPEGAHVVALDEKGSGWTSRELATQLAGWRDNARVVALLVGGPDGLADDCRALAAQTWSLSPLTLPHALVRIVVAEQLYRAWTILAGHPYHRD
ncbi:MAG: 23S rRNA (pseudouridine(1915)-N(3))-methyltransferase RlmH [Xanthomonadaceae bacterium]|nr:23S rRNA (pseudouridine(1915)-N(3))-methyltransferase RlmH [Xanthomonadaceae bacterium]